MRCWKMWWGEITMRFFLLLLITISLYCEDLNSLIQKGFNNNPTIQKLRVEVDLKAYDIANSKLYKNPTITIGINDINFDTPEKRDIEPMQTNFISFSQQITDSDKLSLQTQIKITNQKLILLKIQEEKNKLVKNIYKYYFSYFQLKNQIKLNRKKIENIDKISLYHTNNIQNTKAFQNILSNDLIKEKLHIKILINKEKQKQILINISQLINQDIRTLKKSQTIISNNSNSIEEHTLLLIENLKIEQNNYEKDLALENQSSDYTISAGYYNRNSFDDYASIALKIPLNIYGKEKNNLLKEKKAINVAKHNFEEVKTKLKRDFAIYSSKQNLAKKSLVYIQSIKQHLLKEKELITNKNITNNLVEILMLENKLLDNEIQKTQYTKDMQLALVELIYLTSSLKGLYNE